MNSNPVGFYDTVNNTRYIMYPEGVPHDGHPCREGVQLRWGWRIEGGSQTQGALSRPWALELNTFGVKKGTLWLWPLAALGLFQAEDALHWQDHARQRATYIADAT